MLAVTLLEKIQGDYIWKNYNMAKNIGLPKLAFELLDFVKIQLERSWLTQFLHRNNISIKTPESLESARNKYCNSRMMEYQTQAAKQRILVIAAIINAWNQTATPLNCLSSFSSTGIYPYNLQKVLSNRFVRTTNAEDEFL